MDPKLKLIQAQKPIEEKGKQVDAKNKKEEANVKNLPITNKTEIPDIKDSNSIKPKRVINNDGISKKEKSNIKKSTASKIISHEPMIDKEIYDNQMSSIYNIERSKEGFEIKMDLEAQMRKLQEKKLKEEDQKREEIIKKRKLLLKQLVNDESDAPTVNSTEKPAPKLMTFGNQANNDIDKNENEETKELGDDLPNLLLNAKPKICDKPPLITTLSKIPQNKQSKEYSTEIKQTSTKFDDALTTAVSIIIIIIQLNKSAAQ